MCVCVRVRYECACKIDLTVLKLRVNYKIRMNVFGVFGEFTRGLLLRRFMFEFAESANNNNSNIGHFNSGPKSVVIKIPPFLYLMCYTHTNANINTCRQIRINFTQLTHTSRERDRGHMCTHLCMFYGCIDKCRFCQWGSCHL